MVKQTQTIRQLLPTNFSSAFDHFWEFALNSLGTKHHYHVIIIMLKNMKMVGKKNTSLKTNFEITCLK